MQEAIEKADTLIEAMGWIRQFRGKTTVIKLGGSVLDDEEALMHILIDVIFMETVGMKPVVVHGGGKAISQAMDAAGIEPRFVQGRRYTDDATLGIVELPSRLVETLIAASIVYVALENLFTEELRPHRTLLVFAFGLLHGLGFAGVLQELGLPGELAVALISFSVGVELGQIAVVALALLLVGWFRGKEGYRKFVVVPASIFIAGIALYWTVSRALGV